MEFYTLFERLSRLQTKDENTKNVNHKDYGFNFSFVKKFFKWKNLLKNWHTLTSLILKSRIIIKDIMQFNFFDVHLHPLKKSS